LQENLINDLDLLKSRMISLENRIIPKLCTPPATSVKSNKKK